MSSNWRPHFLRIVLRSRSVRHVPITEQCVEALICQILRRVGLRSVSEAALDRNGSASAALLDVALVLKDAVEAAGKMEKPSFWHTFSEAPSRFSHPPLDHSYAQ